MRAPRFLLAAASLPLGLPLGLAPGLAAAQQPVVVTASTERTAIVETVNMTERSVLLRGDAGAQTGMLASVRVGPEVRNLAQVRPGDRVVVSVTDAVAASLARAGDEAPPAGTAVLASRAPEGARPAGSITEATRQRVRVEGVDVPGGRVVLTTADNERRTVRVQTPRMREFIRTLRPGDMVDVILVETVGLRVLPPA